MALHHQVHGFSSDRH